MTINVWHAKRFGDAGSFPQEFTHVADVEVADSLTFDRALEEAFRLTNHIDGLWWANEGVTLKAESRSTSVGDVEVIDGVQFRVEFAGFKAINANPGYTYRVGDMTE